MGAIVLDMPPKPRSLSVSKQCEDCGSANPVACKSCTACGADFYSSSLDKSDSPDHGSDAPNTPNSDRRRSSRGGGKKPDYYDALEFEKPIGTKRKGSGPTTPTRTTKRLTGFEDKIPYKSPKIKRQHSEGGSETPQRGRPRKTMLDVRDKRNKKKRLIKELSEEKKESSRESIHDPEEEMTTVMDDLPPEKCLKLKVSLAEINRKLGVVMWQPV